VKWATLETLLHNLRAEEVDRLLTSLNIRTQVVQRKAKIQRLKQHLLKREVLRSQWKALPPEAQALWGLLHAMGGWSTVTRLEQMLLLLGIAPLEDGSVQVNGQPVRTLIDMLFQHGLVFPYSPPYFVNVYSAEGNMWLIPQEFQKVLGKAGAQALSAWLDRAVEHDRAEPGDAPGFHRDLLLFWGTTWRYPLPLLKSELLSARALRRLEGTLRFQDKMYVEFLRFILEQLFLVYEVDNTLYAEITDEGQAPPFWSLPLAKRASQIRRNLKELADLWGERRALFLKGTLFDHEIRNLFGKTLDAFANQILSQPERVWTLGHGWLWVLQSMSALFDYEEYHFLDGIALGTGEMEIATVFMLITILYWLGVVDLVYQGENLVGFRASAWASCVWKGRRCQEPQGGQIVVQPSFQVLAMGPVPLNQLAILELVADRVKVEPQVVEYMLTRKTFLQAVQKGVDGEYILKEIQRLSAQKIPQNVQRSLEEWLGELERVQMYMSGTLLYVPDPEVRHELAGLLKNRRKLELEDGHFFISKAAQGPVLDALADRGYGHKEVPSAKAELPDSITVEEGARFRVKQVPPGVYVTGVLRRIAEQEDERTWVVRPEKVRATAQVMPIRQLVKVLEEMAGGRLPQDLKKQLYMWGAHLGRVKMSRIVLLRFPSQESLNLFLKLQKPRRLVQPLAPEQGLAMAREKDVERVLEQLRALGADVEVEG